jgi:hypothetical protein
MKCNENIVFPFITIRKLHFKKKMQLWSKFGWVVEFRTFTRVADPDPDLDWIRIPNPDPDPGGQK